MRLEIYLGRALPVLCLLAALAVGLPVAGLLRGSIVAKNITQYGPLPEIRIPTLDYVALSLSIILLAACVLELMRFRVAAPVALAATLALWAWYIPTLWDQISGNMWFAMKLGRFLGVSWKMVVYQTGAMICAGVLTYMRFRPQARP